MTLKLADAVELIENLAVRVEKLEEELVALRSEKRQATHKAFAASETGCTIEVFESPAAAMAEAKARAMSALAAKFKFKTVGDSLYVTPR